MQKLKDYDMMNPNKTYSNWAETNKKNRESQQMKSRQKLSQ